jgi:hypothetical protein
MSRLETTASTLASALHCGARRYGVEPAPEIGMVGPLHALGVVVARPREGRDVGDRILRAAEIRDSAEPRFEHVVEPEHLGAVAAHRIVVAGRREAGEVDDLAEGRPDPGELDHQPLDDLVAPCRVGGEEAPGLVGEIHQDRARLEHGVGLAARSLVIDDHRNLTVGIERAELGREMVALPDVDGNGAVGQLQLFEHDEDLLHVRAGEHVEVDHGDVPSVGAGAAP